MGSGESQPGWIFCDSMSLLNRDLWPVLLSKRRGCRLQLSVPELSVPYNMLERVL